MDVNIYSTEKLHNYLNFQHKDKEEPPLLHLCHWRIIFWRQIWNENQLITFPSYALLLKKAGLDVRIK